MYLGRYMLGEWVPFKVVTRSTARVPSSPTAAPTLRIYDAAGNTVATSSMPIYQKNIRTGTFILEKLLDSSFSAGQHVALIEFTVGGNALKELHHFEVIAGGHSQGAYLGIHFYRPPHADYLVGITEDGSTDRRKNPKV